MTLEAVPGPGAVTYGENIAYKAEISNTSGSTLTHVIFRMRKPYVGSIENPTQEATFVDSTCPQNGGQGVTVTYADGTSEWTCDLGNLPAWADSTTPQVTLTIVWQTPPLTSPDDCTDCLHAVARVSVKEGLNDQTNPNDVFTTESDPATLLSGESKTVDSKDTTMAGGYEIDPCTDPFGLGSLRTKQNPDAGQNPVSTTVCIPTIPTNENNLGLATTILEETSHPDDPGHTTLGRSNVCVAALGENCVGDYEPQDFGTDHPLTLVFRIADGALPNGEKITVVYHNGIALPTCDVSPTNANGCTQSIDRSGGRVKIWTIVVKSRTNGFYNW